MFVDINKVVEKNRIANKNVNILAVVMITCSHAHTCTKWWWHQWEREEKVPIKLVKKTKPKHEQKSSYQVGAELAGERSVLVQSNCQRARLLVRTCKEIANVRRWFGRFEKLKRNQQKKTPFHKTGNGRRWPWWKSLKLIFWGMRGGLKVDAMQRESICREGRCN